MTKKTANEICAAKKVYQTAAQASVALAKVKRVTDHTHETKTPHSWYRCPNCGYFHLTSHYRELGPLDKEFF